MQLLEPFSGWLPYLVGLVVLYLIVSTITSRYKRVPPNKALLVFGKGKEVHVVKGGGRVVLPVFEEARFLDLEVFTLDIKVVKVNTKMGVQINVDAIAQVKVGSNEDMIRTAAEQFLDKKPEQRDEIALQTMAGHLRAILGTLTVEEIFQQREIFQSKVAETASPDMGTMGLQIISFTIKELHDENQYLESLGAGRTAEVVRDAQIAQAEASRITRQKKAENDQAAQQSELAAATAVAQATTDKDVKIAELKKQSDTAKASADMAYQLQEAQVKRDLATQEGQVEVVRQQQSALAAEVQVNVARQRQIAEVLAPAEASREAARVNAEGQAQALKLTTEAQAAATRVTADAEAERIRATRTAAADGRTAEGNAEANATRADLLAKAEGQQALANALASQGQVNLVLQLAQAVLDAEVRKATAIAAAVGDMGHNMKVVQFSGNGTGKSGNALVDAVMGIPELASMLNAQSDALTGLDLEGLVRRVQSLMKTSEGATLLGTVQSNGHNATTSAPAAADPVPTDSSVAAVSATSEV